MINYSFLGVKLYTRPQKPIQDFFCTMNTLNISHIIHLTKIVLIGHVTNNLKHLRIVKGCI
jgi:hypothetical protein